jgi:hypothetical protein
LVSESRFFSMTEQLPIELQMLVCNAAFEIASSIVLSRDVEASIARNRRLLFFAATHATVFYLNN